ncbi:MAG: Hpt domain-containing protein [Chlorobiaceae bacterium]|nr:Hpt domain-containing protein [Chlorobiaceae bacterium]NTV60464.1 Hpt domain-containing protein [Chlorobiaceae bacterium]
MNNEPKAILNLEDFLNRMMQDRELVKTILDEFLAELPGKLETLGRLVADGNTREASVLAHLIKGEAASVGAERMSRAAYRLELAAKENNTEEVKNNLPSLEENAALFMKTVEEMAI